MICCLPCLCVVKGVEKVKDSKASGDGRGKNIGRERGGGGEVDVSLRDVKV